MHAETKTLAVIGGGRMGEAIVSGLIGSGYTDAASITVAEMVAARREELTRTHGVIAVATAREAAAGAQTIILAVKPQDVGTVASEIDMHIGAETLIISIAAGIPTKYIESRLPHGTKVLRAMPNTPALIGAGVTAICRGLHASAEDMAAAKTILSNIGAVEIIKEELMDAVTALSGSGPAYVFLFIEALIEAGVREGLPRDTSSELALHTVLGSAQLMKETKTHPGLLREMVTSPGGTTAAGLAELEIGGLKAAVLAAIDAANKRSIELGKNLN